MWTGRLLNNEVVGYYDTIGTVFMTLSRAPYNFNFALGPNNNNGTMTSFNASIWIMDKYNWDLWVWIIIDIQWNIHLGVKCIKW